MSKPVPDQRIAAYIEEIEKPGIPFVGWSHCLLYSIGCEHGHELVWGLISEYFEAVKAAS